MCGIQESSAHEFINLFSSLINVNCSRDDGVWANGIAYQINICKILLILSPPNPSWTRKGGGETCLGEVDLWFRIKEKKGVRGVWRVYETENKLTVRVPPKSYFLPRKSISAHRIYRSLIKVVYSPCFLAFYVSEKLPGNFKTNSHPLLPLRECIS